MYKLLKVFVRLSWLDVHTLCLDDYFAELVEIRDKDKAEVVGILNRCLRCSRVDLRA